MTTSTKVQLTDELKRAIGQRFVLGFHGTSSKLDDAASKNIKTLLGAPYYLGNVIMMKRNVEGKDEVREMIRSLQSHARQVQGEEAKPLLIGTDQEGGLVSAFTVPPGKGKEGVTHPGAMPLGRVKDDDKYETSALEMTRKTYEASGKELAMLGVNWVYAPVGDVNTDKRNPVIGVRSFGEEPEKVAKHVAKACEGLGQAGIASCVKHFPGHGDTSVDSHLGMPVIRKGREQLRKEELVPFEGVVGVKGVTVMTGHMAMPEVTGKTYEPCSLSREVTKKLLREEMGFEGVVVTDCLEMDAIARTEASDKEKEGGWEGGCGIEEGAVKAIEADADVVMICHTFEKQVGAIRKVWEAVEDGRIGVEELMKGVERVKKLKDWLGLTWDKVTREDEHWEKRWKELKRENAAIAEEGYRRSVVVRDGFVPLEKDLAKTTLYTPANESINLAVDDAEGVLRTKDGKVRNTAGPSFVAMATKLGCKHVVYRDSVDVQGGQGIFVFRNGATSEWQQRALLAVEKGSSRVVVVSCGTPYEASYDVAAMESTAAALSHVLSLVIR
ncbi:glycoside hydrolase [Dendrothele bispora CBS 962.96]|uniref:Glycoside hydrolase n=1 Tax=Dendrothele bispora (strain CBS 962.96) TaxID=1314807 RepID=A0A4S8LWF7_DENBC|nr:glycoside hydrolase [Dendrothele bispora CBS 962.96]